MAKQYPYKYSDFTCTTKYSIKMQVITQIHFLYFCDFSVGVQAYDQYCNQSPEANQITVISFRNEKETIPLSKNLMGRIYSDIIMYGREILGSPMENGSAHPRQK